MKQGQRRKLSVLGIGLSLLAVMAVVGCGGGGTTPPPSTPPAVAIALGSVTSSLNVGQTFQFSATVSNSTNTAVTWAVNGTAGGSSTVGTISATGLYTAPSLVPSPASVSITATSQADTSKSVSTPVLINLTLAVNVNTATVQVTGTQQFTATITGVSNTAVTWAVDGIVGGNSSVGTISPTGLYTAPQVPPSPNTVTLTATSVANSSISSTITVTVTPPPVSVSVNPTALDLQVNGTVQFTDLVTTTSSVPISTAVNWGVRSPGSPGTAASGTITGNGLYTAPNLVPGSNPIPVYVTSQEDPTKVAIAYVTITTAPVQLQISTPSLPNGIAHTGYSAQLSAFGGAQPYAWSITAGALPLGVILNPSTGLISGTPTTAGTANFTVTVTDQTSPTHETANLPLSITIIPTLNITTAALSNGAVNSVYSSTLAATGGVTPYNWTLTSGTLPSGLSLNAGTGAITGTPAVGSAGTYPLSFMVTDSGTPQQTRSFSTTITIYTGLTILTTSVPNVVVNTAYNQTVSAVGGTSPYTYTLASGSGPLPSPLQLNSATGAITGTPTVPGTYNFTVQVADSSGPQQVKTQALTIIVYSALNFPSVTLPSGVVSTAYSSSLLSASGGTSPYTFAITSGSLPAGLGINSSTGIISGTPTTGGPSNFTVKVTDSSVPAQSQTQSLTITIYTGLAITTTTLPGAIVGTTYNSTVAIAGGTSPFTYSISAGALPGWALLNSSTGAITGTPTLPAGTANFTVQVKDSSVPQQTRTQPLSITTAAVLALPSATLPGGALNVAYSTSLVAATGGTTPYTYSILSGALPTGLGINSTTGVISGTPTASGTANFTVKVVDTGSPVQSQTQSYSITIFTGLTITSTTLPGAVVGTTYNNSVGVSGGTTPYAFSIISGALPTWATLNPTTGAITGTPTIPAGTATFTVQVQDSSVPQQTKTQALSITTATALNFSSVALPGGEDNVAYSTSLVAASGGTTPYAYSIVSGALPGGLGINSTSGVISGTPTAGGNFTFGVKVTDSSVPAQTHTQSFSITVLAVTTTSLPSSTVGVGYNQTLTATGGSGVYTWGIISGSLPVGCLTLNTSTGAITGTPTSGCVGTTNFTVQVTDTSTPNLVASQALSVTINAAAQPLTITTTSLSDGTVGIAYNNSVSVTGGTSPYTWSIISGSLPCGFGLSSSTGAITGTPTSACLGGPYSFTVKVVDSASASRTQALSITIDAASSSVCESGSESLLNGQYAFSLEGFNGNGFTAVVGSFTANGSGGITGGEADTNGGFGLHTAGALSSSTYTVGADNRGCATIVTSFGTLTTRFSLGGITSGKATQGSIIEFDAPTSSAFIASGKIYQQNASTFSTTLSGGYVAFFTGWDSTVPGRIACANVKTASGGNFTNGEQDCNDSGTLSHLTGLTGTYSTSADSRGRLITVLGSNNTAAYMIDTTHLLIIKTDASPVLSGEVRQQSGTLNNATLNGPFVLYMNGLNNTTSGKVAIYQFNANGAGTETVDYSYENDSASNFFTPVANGTNVSYSVASNGRVTGAGAGISYLTTTNTGYYLNNESGGGVFAGYLVPQTVPGGGFTNANIAGTSFDGTSEVVNQGTSVNLGIVTLDGAGNVAVISDNTSTGGQQADQVSTSTTTIASGSLGTFTVPGDHSTTQPGIAIAPGQFVIVDGVSNNYPRIEVAGQSSADTSVGISITSPSTPQTVPVNGTVAVTTSVTGTSNTGITWTFNGVAGGAGFGNISGAYPNFTYTAPASVPSPATFSVTATSNADVSKTASFTVTISSGVTVSITTPTSPQTVIINNTLGFTASVTGASNTAVTWSVNGVTNGNSTFGTITGSGLSVTYNAPASIPSPGTFNVTATSVEEPSQSASVSVTIAAAAPIVVTLDGQASSSTSATVGGTLPVTASVTGAAPNLSFTLNGASSPSSLYGSISGSYPSYTYHLPTAIPGNNNPVVIEATQGGTGQTATLSVTVNPSGTGPNAITLSGSGNVTGINLSLTSFTPTLGLSDVGTCNFPTPNSCSANVTGIAISRSGAATSFCGSATCEIWLVGEGLTNGAGTTLSSGLTVQVSHGSGASDVTVSALQPNGPISGLTDIFFQIVVSSSAAVGNRDIIVTLGDGEINVYPGAIQIVN